MTPTVAMGSRAFRCELLLFRGMQGKLSLWEKKAQASKWPVPVTEQLVNRHLREERSASPE
jgi:hypothetical protein